MIEWKGGIYKKVKVLDTLIGQFDKAEQQM